jgi:hypothetical protein
MKKIALLSLSFGLLVSVFAQTGTSLLLEPLGKKVLLYVDLEKDSCLMFQLTYFMDKAGTGYNLEEIDTMYPTDSTFHSYRGVKSTLEIVDHKAYVHVPGYKPFKGKRTRMGSYHDDPEIVYDRIKNGYWWRQFLKLSDEINLMFPWQHFSFRNGFGYWDHLEKKHYQYNNFREVADKNINFLRDSLIAAESQHTRTTKYVTENIATIEYAALKDSLLSLPRSSYMHRYFNVLINEVCLNRPEFFFRLMDDLPNLKVDFIYAVDRNKATMEKLRSVDTDSRSKRDFFKKSY